MKLRIGCVVVGCLSLGLSMAAQTPGGGPVCAPSTKSGTASAAVSSEDSAPPSAAVTGSGTTNYIPVWKSSTTLGNSLLYETSGSVGIGTTHPNGSELDVAGHIDTTKGYNIGGNTVLTLPGPVNKYNIALGYQAYAHYNGGTLNTAIGAYALGTGGIPVFDTAIGAFALYNDAGGVQNTATGSYALYANLGDQDGNGTLNTADGNFALTANTTGSENTAVGTYALDKNSTGSNLTCIGYGCTTGDDGLNNATAIGAHAVVSESNTLVLGGTGMYAVKVGIGTERPSNILTIAQGAGHPVSDGWETFSSRRWKTNIQTLHGALWKVERLRGVSYDSKAGSKHEVGVIAEEVGAVVPEVVTWDKNGKDAQSVDYSRLTALLIEAVKQQQREIRDLRSELRATRQTLQKVKGKVAPTQPTLVAAK
jgi:hypothetical protein